MCWSTRNTNETKLIKRSTQAVVKEPPSLPHSPPPVFKTKCIDKSHEVIPKWFLSLVLHFFFEKSYVPSTYAVPHTVHTRRKKKSNAIERKNQPILTRNRRFDKNYPHLSVFGQRESGGWLARCGRKRNRDGRQPLQYYFITQWYISCMVSANVPCLQSMRS